MRWIRHTSTLAIAAVLLVGGFFLADWRADTAGARQQQMLLSQVSSIAQTIDVDDANALSFTSADAENPHFQRLRAHMVAWTEALRPTLGALSEHVSIYSMTAHSGRLVFGPESIAAHDPMASPPGTVYTSPPEAAWQAIDNRRPSVTQPYTDEYGAFVSAFSPVLDPRTGKVVLVVGLDIKADTWHKSLARERMIAGGFVLALALILLSCRTLFGRRTRVAADRRGLLVRQAESVTAAAVGIALIIALAYLADESETAGRNRAFSQLAEAQMNGVVCTVRNVCNAQLGSLASFFEGSESVERSEFKSFAGKLAQNPCVSMVGWAKRVRDGRDEPQVNAGGDRYRITYIEPEAKNQEAIGLDLDSDTATAAALEDSIRTGAVVATRSASSVSHAKPSIAVYSPVVTEHPQTQAAAPDGASPPTAAGFVFVTLLPDKVLERAVGHSSSEQSVSSMDMYELNPGVPPALLASSSRDHANAALEETQMDHAVGVGPSVITPLFLFGQTYAIVAHPGDAFLLTNPRQAGLQTLLAGLFLTALLTCFVAFVSKRRTRLEQRVQEYKRQQDWVRRSIINNLASGVVIVDCETHIVEEINPAAAALLGDSPENIKGRVCHNLLCPASKGNCPVTDLGKPINNAEAVLLSRDGTRSPVLKSVTRVKIDGREKLLESFVDISDRKQTENDLDFQVHHDALTGLPNRVHFNKTLSRLLHSKRKADTQIGVMFIDLDRFKIVNDSLGHDVGDLLLVDVAKRLAGCLRELDLLCRMGGDEFTVILRPVNDLDEVREVADRILREMTKPFKVRNREITVGASIGISVYPRDGTDVANIVKRADTAMYKAKELGRNNCQTYSPDMDADALDRLQLESELRAAIRKKEIEVYCQPRIEPLDNSLVGAEALIRWNHPTRGLLPAGEFIKVAEEMGIVSQIGELVVGIICSRLKEWNDAGCAPYSLALNLSGEQLRQPDDIESIERAISNYGLAASQLALEIPGASLAAAPEAVIKKIQELRDQGLSVILDDFGTGGVSVVALKNAPVDYVKIEGLSADSHSSDNWDSSAIAASITATAHNMGLEVIAVGVETQEQMELAASLMCSMVQGYLVSPPLTADEYGKLVVSASAGQWRPAA